MSYYRSVGKSENISRYYYSTLQTFEFFPPNRLNLQHFSFTRFILQF